MKKTLLLLFASLFAATAFAQSAPTQGVLDSVLMHFNQAAVKQIIVSQGFAKGIFVVLLGFDIAIFALKKLLSSGNIEDWIGGIALKCFSWGFFYTLIVMGPQWIPLFIQSFMEMGTKIAGGTALITPSGVMDLAFNATSAIWKAYTGASSGLSIGDDIMLALAGLTAILLTIFAFAIITLELIATQIELALVGSVCFFMLGLSGAPATMQFAEKYFGYIVSAGIKLVVICAMAGFGATMTESFVGAITKVENISPINLLLATTPMLIYGILASKLPAMAGAVMNGAPSLSAGSLAGGAAAIAGGVAGAGMAAAGAAAGLAGKAVGGNAAAALDNLSKLTNAGNGISAPGESYDRLASLSSGGGASGGRDSIGNPNGSNFGTSSESSKPSMFKDGLNKMSDAGSKIIQQEGGGGSGISIRFNQLGE